MKSFDLNFFPGWTRKAMTFTIDDGWLDMDQKFISIVRPYGIKGAFNISSHNATKHNNPELIRETYRGFEITNHVRLHPLAFKDAQKYTISEEIFNRETADKSVCYREAGTPEGVYLRYDPKTETWKRFCTAQGYITLTKEGHEELEEIFGKGTVTGFVWPFCRQENSELIKYLEANYYGMRDAGKQEPMETPDFPLPDNRNDWHYNARHSNLLKRGEEFEALEAEKLAWFAFGVHSVDFDRAENWCDLEEFCKKYGNRPEDFWYATNKEIFDYEDAVKGVEVTENSLKNPSEIDLCIKIDGKRITLPAHGEIEI